MNKRPEKKVIHTSSSKSYLRLLPKLSKVEWSQLAVVIGLGISLRIWYLIQFEGSIFYNHYVLDSMVLDNWAKEIASGNVLGNTAFFRAPLYPYLIAILYKFIGTSHLIVTLFQNLLGIASVYLTYIYSRHLFGSKIALLAGLLMAWFPTLIYYEGELMLTSLEVFFSVLTIVLIQRALELKSPRAFVITGLVLGFATITRPTFLVFALVLPLFTLVLSRRKVSRKTLLTALYLLGLIIPIIPVTIRNYVVADDAVLISTQAGANFYIGNSKQADGISVIALGAEESAEKYQDNIYTSSVRMAEREVGHRLKDSEVSSYWSRKTLREMMSDPVRAAGLLFKKLYLFWYGEEIMNDRSVYYGREYSTSMQLSVWRWLINFPSGLLFPLMILGFYFAFKNQIGVDLPLWLVILYSLGISLFFVCSRFRQPIIPIACMMAAYGGYQLVHLLKRSNARGKGVALSILLGAIIVLNVAGDVESKPNQSQFEYILGNAYFEEQNLPEAATHLEKALAVEPDNIAVYGLLGTVYAKQQRLDDAEQMLLNAIERYPNYSVFNYNLGLLYAQKMDVERAKRYLRRTIELDRQFPYPYLRLGEIFSFEHKPDSSRLMYQLLLQVDPNNADARARLEN